MESRNVIGKGTRLLSSLVAINKRFPLLVLTVWAILCGPRPFQFGFYHDDWWTLIETAQGTSRFSLERFHNFVGATTPWGARPGSGIAAFLVSSISGSSTFMYHLCAVVLVLCAALSLRAWLMNLPFKSHPQLNLIADLTAAFWISLPWMLATSTFLTSAVQALPAQILFTEAARRLNPDKRLSAGRLLSIGCLLLASYLTYESFYFLFFLVAAFYLVFHRSWFSTKWTILGFVGVVLGSQLVAVGVNRYLAHINPQGSKTFVASWLTIYVESLTILPNHLRSTIITGASQLWVYAIYILLFVSLLLLCIALGSRLHRRAAVGSIGIFLAGTAALFLATLTYALAGYGYTVGGIGARTLQPASLAITIIFFSLVSLALFSNSRLLKSVLLASGILIVLLDGISQKARAADWIYVWNQQQKILQSAPIEAFRTLPSGSQVLYIGPSYYRGLVIFGAEWDLTPAVFSSPVLSRGRKAYQEFTWIYPATMMYAWKWDGTTLVQQLPGYWEHRFPVKRLFVWNFDERTFLEVPAGFAHSPK